MNWTNTGLATLMSRSDFLLAAGQCCYVSVKARNYTGLTSDVGVSTVITVVADDSNQVIGDAKKRPDEYSCRLAGQDRDRRIRRLCVRRSPTVRRP